MRCKEVGNFVLNQQFVVGASPKQQLFFLGDVLSVVAAEEDEGDGR